MSYRKKIHEIVTTGHALSGGEIFYSQQRPDSPVPYFWIYTGHKEGKGRITIRVAYPGREKPDGRTVETVTVTARALFASLAVLLPIVYTVASAG